MIMRKLGFLVGVFNSKYIRRGRYEIIDNPRYARLLDILESSEVVLATSKCLPKKPNTGDLTYLGPTNLWDAQFIQENHYRTTPNYEIFNFGPSKRQDTLSRWQEMTRSSVARCLMSQGGHQIMNVIVTCQCMSPLYVFHLHFEKRIKSSMNDEEWLHRIRLEIRAYSNNPISITDQTALRRILMNATDEIKSVESDISRLREAILNLEKRRVEGLAHIERLRVGLAPHKRLPPEILSRMFIHCDGSPLKLPPRYYKSTWAVTQVCSRWRSIALSEPRLWSQIKVRGNEKTDCLKALIYDIFSNRGGQGMISYDTPWITGPEEWQNVVALLTTYPSRLLNLKIPLVGFVPQSFETPLSLFDNLESISISFRHLTRHDAERNRIMAFSTATNLRKVSVRISQRDTSLLSTWPTSIVFPWGQLIHLTIDVIPISIFLKILLHCASLVTCEIRLRDGPHSPEAKGNPIELNFLHSLVILDNTSYPAAGTLLDNIVTPALKSLKFGDEEWDEWPQESILNLISQSMCEIEMFETPAGALAEKELLPLMRAMPRLKDFSAFTKQLISSSTLNTIRSENIAPELCKLDGWRVASIHPFIELLRSRQMRKDGGIQTARVWIPEDVFAPDREYFRTVFPELTKNGRQVKVLAYSKSWETPTSESG